jgi:hypothetical protein
MHTRQHDNAQVMSLMPLRYNLLGKGEELWADWHQDNPAKAKLPRKESSHAP